MKPRGLGHSIVGLALKADYETPPTLETVFAIGLNEPSDNVRSVNVLPEVSMPLNQSLTSLGSLVHVYATLGCLLRPYVNKYNSSRRAGHGFVVVLPSRNRTVLLLLDCLHHSSLGPLGINSSVIIRIALQ